MVALRPGHRPIEVLRIGLPVVLAVDHHYSWGRGRHGTRAGGREPAELDGGIDGREGGQAPQEALGLAGTGRVEGDGDRIGHDLVDHVAQPAPGPYLDEELDTVGGHPADQLTEAHRAGQLGRQHVRQLAGDVAVRPRGGVGVDVDGGSLQPLSRDRLPETVRGRTDKGGVEGGGNVEPGAVHTSSAQHLLELLHRSRRPGHGHLAGCVVVDHPELRETRFPDPGGSIGSARGNSGHAGRTVGRRGHQQAPGARQPQQGVAVVGTRHMQRHQFAEAVPGRGGGPRPRPVEQRQQSQ